MSLATVGQHEALEVGERCAWFRDLRFDFPGREEGPFRYGVCLPATPGEEAKVFKLDGALRTRVR